MTRWVQRFENLEKSVQNLEDTRDCIKREGINKIYTMALIQAYEIVFELSCARTKASDFFRKRTSAQ